MIPTTNLTLLLSANAHPTGGLRMPSKLARRPWLRGIVCAVPIVLVAAGCSTPAGSPAPDDVQVPVAVGLRRDQAGLAQAVANSANPSGGQFLSQLTAQNIATTYGTNPNNAQEALKALQGAGFSGSLDPTGSIITGLMAAKDAEAFFGVDLRLVTEDNVQVIRPSSPPSVPSSLAAFATEVAGFARSIPSGTATPSAPATPNLPPCPPPIALTARLRTYYGLDAIYAGGNTGQGLKLAMLEIDQLSQPAITLFEKCFKVQIPPVTNTIVADANPEAFGDEAEESTLDIVAAGLLAPNLDGIQTYQFDPYTSMVFALNDAVSASYQPDGPEILSTSIGVCEQNLQGPEISIMEWILNAGAATGLTTVASSGDDGSSACYPQTKDQASQYPGTSGVVTALGGTEFVGTGGPRPSEVVWNNSPAQEQAGGGSQVSRMPKPSYQNSLPGPNNRIIPDIALVAEPADFGPIPVCKNNGQCQMQVVGGTSATAPGYAAALATMLQQLRKNNGAQLRLGSMNPMFYNIAASPSNSSVLNDITQGTNDLYSAGCCTAAPGYDSASGWGSINFGGLLKAYESSAPKS